MITQKELKILFVYDESLGVLKRRVTRGSAKKGSIAGCMNHGYRDILINKRTYKAHRLIWLYVYGVWPKHEIDHINHIKTDNRVCNLREATRTQNNKNASRRKDNTTGVTGVGFFKRGDTWRARIHINGELTHLGYFFDKFEAICTRKSAENRYGYHINHGT